MDTGMAEATFDQRIPSLGLLVAVFCRSCPQIIQCHRNSRWFVTHRIIWMSTMGNFKASMMKTEKIRLGNMELQSTTPLSFFERPLTRNKLPLPSIIYNWHGCIIRSFVKDDAAVSYVVGVPTGLLSTHWSALQAQTLANDQQAKFINFNRRLETVGEQQVHLLRSKLSFVFKSGFWGSRNGRYGFRREVCVRQHVLPDLCDEMVVLYMTQSKKNWDES